ITVDLFSFVLPPQSVDRSSFKMTLILGYTVFLKTPLINVFFSISLALMVASLLETLFITNIQYKPREYSAVPHWLSVLVLRYLAVLVCILQRKGATESQSPSIHLTKVRYYFYSPVINRFSPASLDSPEPVVEQLRMLGRELTAIRVQMDKYCQGTKATQEWEMIGTVIDRLLFGLYIIFIFVSFITIISIWIWHNSFAT
uniref:Neurotransmitter-gated ion-channel transmembrane domain-containing protein n=1 Tax=Oreochromis niloticus TaxID=8128 RepID=I3K1B4_ORENI